MTPRTLQVRASLSLVASFVVACATAEELGDPTLGLGFLDGGLGTGNSSFGGNVSGFGGASNGSTSGLGGANPGGGGANSAGGARSTGGASSGAGGASSGAGGASSGAGGAASAGGVAATGGVSSGSGGKASGGAPSAGGKASTGGAAPCPDTDGDGADDCVEDGDGDAWTDRAVFNGLHVSRANQCSASGNCGENDAFSEVTSCMQNVSEQLDQHAGWDWENPPDDICDGRYGFAPNWKNCDSSWAAEWQGCIHLKTAGPHCFEIAGGTSEGCAALYFNGNTANADTQSGKGVKCFSVAAGNYPILLHYTMDNGSSSSMHVRYCDAAGGTTCTPATAIPAQMLRTTCGP